MAAKMVVYVCGFWCRSQGWISLYKGLEAKLTQTVATAALMFLIYEKIAALVLRVMQPQRTLRLAKTA